MIVFSKVGRAHSPTASLGGGGEGGGAAPRTAAAAGEDDTTTTARAMQCKICFEEPRATRVTRCGHVFCAECLGIWVREHPVKPSCPVCRKEVDPSTVVEVFDDRAGSGSGASSPGLDGGDLSAAGVEDYLRKLTTRYSRMERENAVLRARVAELSSEVNLLSALRRTPPAPPHEDDSKENEPPRPPVGVDTGSAKARSLSPLRAERIYRSHRGPVHGIDVSPDGRLVATASWDRTCKVHRVSEHEEREGGRAGEMKKHAVGQVGGVSLEHEHGIYAVAFSPLSVDRRPILATASGNSCFLWDASNGARRLRAFEHECDVNGLAFSSDGKTLVSARADHSASHWDLETGARLLTFEGHQGECYGVCLAKSLVLTCSFDRTVRVYDLRSAELVSCLQGHEKEVIGLDCSDRAIATGSDDGTCRVWDLRKPYKQICTLHHDGEVKRVKFGRADSKLATCSGAGPGRGLVRIYDTASLHCVGVAAGHQETVFDVAWGVDGHIFTASHDATWRSWREA